MTKKFNPAPPDKHAEKPTDRVRHDLKPDASLAKASFSAIPKAAHQDATA
jgi:hypothetical protein